MKKRQILLCLLCVLLAALFVFGAAFLSSVAPTVSGYETDVHGHYNVYIKCKLNCHLVSVKVTAYNKKNRVLDEQVLTVTNCEKDWPYTLTYKAPEDIAYAVDHYTYTYNGIGWLP